MSRTPGSTLPSLFPSLSGICHEDPPARDELRNILQYVYAPNRLFIFKADLLIGSILKRIASLRDEVFLIRVQTEVALEEIPGENIVISVDSGLALSTTLTNKISVVIKHLVTTDHHIQSSSVFAPALTTRHLDSFTDVEALISNLKELTIGEVSSIPM